MKLFLMRYLPPVMWMGVIFSISSFSSLPGPQTDQIVWWDFILKKTAHMIEYGILFYLWQRAINWKGKNNYRGYAAAFVIVFLYALSDEYHQSLSPTRHPRAYDVGFDLLGAGLMYLKLRKWI